jgi:hypothetical protein
MGRRATLQQPVADSRLAPDPVVLREPPGGVDGEVRPVAGRVTAPAGTTRADPVSVAVVTRCAGAKS